ncbi:hypothetical protein [Citrobacter freundii]|uniref:hypothetical protein n=1 Tax=Citrobacter freundii TaxID=546 RepID=UPI001B35FB6A|nr:hypothetical protein [Citrobacter freundii]MBQ0243224.1 hypothetical protein [Citrobacter freundii]HEE9886178.1 hypothetical protein [Citrobacter braakii]
MSNKIRGGLAFPVPGYKYIDEQYYTRFVKATTGMQLRDYFAAKAMQGILANPGQLDNVTDSATEWVAEDAYRVADAMLKAREAS